jgi:protein SCO1/2
MPKINVWETGGLTAALLLAWTLMIMPAQAQSVDAVTGKLQRAGIQERLGEQVDRDAVLVDEDGNEVTLADFLDPDKPVLLNFVYHTCPMLCSMVLEATAKSVSQLKWTPGNEFQIVSVSISDTDTPESATRQKARYIKQLGNPDAADGWHFLTGAPDQVARVAESVGFAYEKNEDNGQYGHAAVIILLAPDGSVSRYMYGIDYQPFDLRAGLVEAAEGKIGNLVDRFIMYCFQYDPAEGSYVAESWLAMRLAGGLTILLLVSGMGFLWMRDRKNSTIMAKEDGDDSRA